MITAYIPLFAITVIVATLFSWQRRKGFSVDTLLFKVVASLCFILCGITALMLSDSIGYGGLIVFGGVLGLCGDAFLDMKGIYPESRVKYMYAGIISFLVGHVFYVSALLLVNQLKITHIIICVVISLVVSAANLFGEKLLKLDYECFKLIVFIYGFVLFMTLSVSIMSFVVNGYSFSRLMMMLGAIFFVLSDLILNNTYFGKGFDGPVWYFTNHLSYYYGQILIMTSILNA